MGLFEKNTTTKTIELPEHYASIDELVMTRWSKIHKEHDPIYLIVKQRVSPLSKEQREQLQKVWEKIYNEFIEVFGIGEQALDILNLKIRIGKLKMKYIIEKDESIKNFIRSFEKQLRDMEEKLPKDMEEGRTDLYSVKNVLERAGYGPISMQTCTVREFYSYIRDLKKQSKQPHGR